MASKRLKVKITVSVQLQRALNDTRRGIRVLSSEMIGKNDRKKCKCICFIETNDHLPSASPKTVLSYSSKSLRCMSYAFPILLTERTQRQLHFFRPATVHKGQRLQVDLN